MRIYDPSGDSTIPSTSKKRKFEEVAEDDAPETPAAKIKKPKKEPVIGVCNGKKTPQKKQDWFYNLWC